MTEAESLSNAHETFSVTVEETMRFDATIDADALIESFVSEWEDFMRDDEPTNDDKWEFVKECLDVMGAQDFFAPDSPWVLDLKEDNDLDVRMAGPRASLP